ncbi:MAG: hypothetical protein QF463_13190 [Vicinamibacterales bacterium]|nr:hypothetical protein [Vicinamibacterales bacterium]MDP6610019.1 hypothetical protein [Vicinamibacterales bacterium]
MLSRPLTLGALFLASFVAVGTGAYLAVRQNDADAGAAAVAGQTARAAAPVLPTAPIEPPTQAVEATETVVNEATEPPAESTVTVDAVLEDSPRPETRNLEETVPVTAPDIEEPDPGEAPEAIGAETSPTPPEAIAVEPPTLADVEAPRSATDEWIGLDQPWPEDMELETVGRGAGATARATGDDLPRLDLEELEELVVAADSVIGLELETRVSSESAQVEDRVDATVARDVLVGERVAIPAGAQLQGSVVLVEQGGRMSETARIGVRFHTLVMPDRTHMSIVTDPVYREGEGQGGRSAKTIGGAAVTGAILGAIFGGRRGAAVGGAAGAATGTASVMTGDRSRTTLLPGMTLTVRLIEPVAVLVDR